MIVNNYSIYQALAFVPVNEVVTKFDELVATLSEEDEERIDEWLEYMLATWIGPVRRNVRRSPRFPLAWWNLHERVLNGQARTNNSLEGWHRAFDQRVGCTHPSLRNLMHKIRVEQAANELLMEQHRAGIQLAPPKLCYRATTQRIQIVVQNYAIYE